MSSVALPPEIQQVLKRMFSSPDLEEATGLLAAFVQIYPNLRDGKRVLHDIVFGADGDIIKFRRLAALAQRDWRDLIMAVEHQLVDGKIVKKEGFPLYQPAIKDS